MGEEFLEEGKGGEILRIEDLTLVGYYSFDPKSILRGI